MKNRKFIHTHEEARIYRKNYRPSLNVFRFLKSILCVVLSGSSASAHGYDYSRKAGH